VLAVLIEVASTIVLTVVVRLPMASACTLLSDVLTDESVALKFTLASPAMPLFQPVARARTSPETSWFDTEAATAANPVVSIVVEVRLMRLLASLP
jgi:hypothetical protein